MDPHFELMLLEDNNVNNDYMTFCGRLSVGFTLSCLGLAIARFGGQDTSRNAGLIMVIAGVGIILGPDLLKFICPCMYINMDQNNNNRQNNNNNRESLMPPEEYE